ncbi:MAG: tetratricopeptide repeat protein, partial [Myxococcota bacterium]
KIGELRVISRTSIMQFKGTRASLPEVARELNVDAIVEGSVLRVGDDVRITAQLIDARTDHHLWSESYAGTMENILALQGRVAQAIAREIERELRPSAEPRRIDPDAHVAYLKGLYYSRQHTADASHKAIEQYRRSINLAPDYSLPYAGMADTFACSPLHAWTIPDSELWPSLPQEIMARARAAAEKALALDETLAEPHTALAIVRWIGELDWSGSEAALMSALDRNPNESFTHLVYAHLLGVLGRMEEAKEENRRASELDPLDVRLVVQRGDLYWQAGETTKAEAQWRKAIQLDPTHHPAQRGLGRALCERGRLEEAAAAFEKARTLSQDDPMVLMELGYCYAKTGRTEDARAVLGWLDQRSAAAYVSPMSRAGLHVGLGDQAETFRWLERAFETRDFNLSYLLLDPRYDPLRSDGRYQSLIRRMGLPQAAVGEIMIDSSVMMNRSCLHRGSSPRAGTCAGASGREG